LCSDNAPMAQGKRISADIDSGALEAIRRIAAAARLGVHVQTIARIESGEPGVAIGHMMGMLALYGIETKLLLTGDSQPDSS
jgi:HTH-type transcriptional regulator/antitoxin HipB